MRARPADGRCRRGAPAAAPRPAGPAPALVEAELDGHAYRLPWDRRPPLLDVRTAPTWPGCVLTCQALPLSDRVHIGYA
ncbi:hypothetical protein [Streptomyces sp. NPDC048551]|uniref:hypothetical protein n=1 Tax=Streptomyces sp. NPDC048551 TaxID=3155758 RepID=UPI0034293601